MRNSQHSRAALALIDLEWFGHELLQQVREISAAVTEDPAAVAALLDDAAQQIAEMHRTFTRPRSRRLMRSA